MSRRKGLVCLLFVLLASSAEAAVRHVVVLQSFERGSLVLDQFMSSLRVRLDDRLAEPVTFAEFVVSPSGFEQAPEQAMVTFLQTAYAGRPKPDLVITSGGTAAAFARRHRTQLFPDSPVIYALVDQRFLAGGSLTERETAVAVANDPTGIIADILRLFPDTENLFVVFGSGALGEFWRGEFERESVAFRDRLKLIWPYGLTYAAMLERAATLPPRSAIIFNSFQIDAEGAIYPTARVLADLRARARAPLFGSQSAELGHGVIGGNLMSTDEVARRTTDVALRILAGETPARIVAPVQQPGPYTFDWRELQRWGIPEARLPSGSIIRFREPGVWDRYKWAIVGSAAALAAQTVLITALLVNRIRRRRVEESLQAARVTLANLNRRLMDVQEQERSRVARELHDDVCQQLTMLALNLERLNDTIPEAEADTRRRVRDLYKEVRALGQHVNAMSHRLHSPKLEFLGLSTATAMFCKDVAAQHGVGIEFVHEGVPATFRDGVAINVFRVMQEALANAVKHSGASRYRVSLRGTDDRLQLEVSDDGRGFDPGAALAKSGLGMVTMRERLTLVQGDLTIESNQRSGTRVLASIPLRPVAGPADAGSRTSSHG
jgi:signal transduction histidine kinase